MRIWGPPTGNDNEAGNEGVLLQNIQGGGESFKFFTKTKSITSYFQKI